MSYLIPKKRGLRPHQILLLLVGGALLGLGAAFLVLSPRIVSISPGTDERAGSYAPVEIQFSAAMKTDCTADHFSVEPAVDGELAVQGSMLRFTPGRPWPEGTAVRVSIRAGACSGRGLPLLAGRSWSFTVSAVRIAYIPVGDSDNRLMGAALAGGDPVELTRLPSPIQNFDISPRGDFAVLSTGLSGEPGQLWIAPLNGQSAELLLDCGEDSCRDPALSPDGLSVAYVRARRPTAAGGPSVTSDPFVELLILAGRETRRISPAGHAAENPIWSAQGWLSYFDGTREVILVDDLSGGQTAVPNSTGSAWSWLPDGTGIIFPEIAVEGGSESEDRAPRLISHLIRVDLKTNQRSDLSGSDFLEDSSPAVSTDGRWLAFARNFFDDRWTPGKQLWIMNLEDFTLRQLTQTPDYNHSSIHWNRDGSRLVFMRFHETVPEDPPEIWCLNADGSDPRRVVTGGFLPQWLP